MKKLSKMKFNLWGVIGICFIAINMGGMLNQVGKFTECTYETTPWHHVLVVFILMFIPFICGYYANIKVKEE